MPSLRHLKQPYPQRKDQLVLSLVGRKSGNRVDVVCQRTLVLKIENHIGDIQADSRLVAQCGRIWLRIKCKERILCSQFIVENEGKRGSCLYAEKVCKLKSSHQRHIDSVKTGSVRYLIVGLNMLKLSPGIAVENFWLDENPVPSKAGKNSRVISQFFVPFREGATGNGNIALRNTYLGTNRKLLCPNLSGNQGKNEQCKTYVDYLSHALEGIGSVQN